MGQPVYIIHLMSCTPLLRLRKFPADQEKGRMVNFPPRPAYCGNHLLHNGAERRRLEQERSRVVFLFPGNF